jgi:adiponectin receptor
MLLDILDTFDVSKFRIRKQDPTEYSRVVVRPRSSTETKKNPRKTRDSIPQRVLLTLGEVPKWYDINPFILTGYRHQTNSLLGCLASWTYVHNESGNIYSHLIPAVAAIFGHRLLYNYLRAEYANLRDKDWTIISLQLWAALACMSTSTMYHTMICHSPKVKHNCLMYDYVGIIAVMLGNFISGIYFGFYCEPRLRLTYWILVHISPFFFGLRLSSNRYNRSPQ